MIGIDIDMPKECDECIFCTNKINNDYGYYGQCFICKDLRINLLMHKKEKECPLKKIKIPHTHKEFAIDELKKIKKEIRKDKSVYFYNENKVKGYMECIKIIDRYMNELKKRK